MFGWLACGVVPLWLASCGGASKDDDKASGSSASGGSSGSGAGATGAGAAGAGNAGGALGGTGGRAGSTGASGASVGGSSGRGGSGTAGTMSLGGSGGMAGAMSSGGNGGTSGEAGAESSGSGGTGDTGGTAGTGATAGTGSSVGGEGPGPGFPCFTAAPCAHGQRCVSCEQGDTYVGLCTPDPDADPAGYEAATASCASVLRYSECDGPEDCAASEYCAYTTGSIGAHCVTEAELPNPVTANCCFTCDAGPVCTLCWNDADCPEALSCVGNPAAPRHVGGCRPPN